MRPSPRSLRHIGATENRDWLPVEGQPHIIVRNARMGVTVTHVVWEQDGKGLYDQPLLIEPIGTIGFLLDPQTKKIGLVSAQRPLVRDEAAYVSMLPDVDPANLGCVVWEVPRGLPIKGESQEETVDREVSEESGGRVRRKRKLELRVNLNSTYFPQCVPIWIVEVDMSQPSAKTDPLEGIIGKAEFFSLEEFALLRTRGECVDPLAGDVIAFLLITEPQLLR